MNVELNYEQRAHLELIAMHSGKPASSVMLEAAEFLLTLDPRSFCYVSDAAPQSFLTDAELDARLASLLRN